MCFFKGVNHFLVGIVREVLKGAPDIEAEELNYTYRESLRAQRSTLLDLRHDGVITDDVFDELAAEIDTDLTSEYTDPESSFTEKK